jgi:hypothetical protein
MKDTELERIVNTDAGKIFSTYWCQVCVEVMRNDPYDSGDTFGFGELKANDEFWEETRKKIEDGKVK